MGRMGGPARVDGQPCASTDNFLHAPMAIEGLVDNQHPALAQELVSTTGPISASPSTSNWQQLNSVILERVREELCIAAGDPRVTEEQYIEWVKATCAPPGSQPLVVRCASSSNPDDMHTANRFALEL